MRTMGRVFGPPRLFDLGSGLHPDRGGVKEDNIPDGEGDVSPGQPVHASDGPIGHVRALVADAVDHQLTQVILDEGHLWEQKEVGVPIGAVSFVVDDGVYLNLTKKEIGDLHPTDRNRSGQR